MQLFRRARGYVSLTRFLCRSFLKRGLINWQKGCSGPKPVSPLESALLLTVKLALRDLWKTSESNATSRVGRAERDIIFYGVRLVQLATSDHL